MSAPDGILREVAEALGNYFDVETGEAGLFVNDARPWGRPNVSTEDVLQALPEHLWERVSVTRVAPGRFVVVEAQEVPEVKPFSCRLRAVPPKGWIGLLLLLFAIPGAAQTLAGTVTAVTDDQTCQRVGLTWDAALTKAGRLPKESEIEK